jgi:hypothetical protein
VRKKMRNGFEVRNEPNEMRLAIFAVSSGIFLVLSLMAVVSAL